MRSVIVQDLWGEADAAIWPAVAEAGATHALVGVAWASVEPEPGRYNTARAERRVAAVQAAGLVPIVRLLWPMPAWAPTAWAGRTVDGLSSMDESVFLRAGLRPSMWCDPAWEALWRCQDTLSRALPGCAWSPAGGGGGEWTHPTSHMRPGWEERVRSSLWCFDEWALKDWRRARWAGRVEGAEPPRGFPEAWERPGFIAWYRGALFARLGAAVWRSPGAAWVALIPKPGYAPEVVASGQPMLDHMVAEIRPVVHVIVHSLFGPGNTADSRAYCVDLMEHGWRGLVAVGVEGWEGLADHAQWLARTSCTHLLVGHAGLAGEGREQLTFWARWWRSLSAGQHFSISALQRVSISAFQPTHRGERPS